MLEQCLVTSITSEDREKYVAHAVKFGKELGVDKILDEYDLNLIIGPIESPLPSFAAAAGLVPESCQRRRNGLADEERNRLSRCSHAAWLPGFQRASAWSLCYRASWRGRLAYPVPERL